MLNFIKNTILGNRFFQRTGSADVHSKGRGSLPKKKPLSFDSKQKQERDALLTSQRNQRPEIIMQDETVTIKKYSYSKGYGEISIKNEDYTLISDIDEGFQSLPKKQPQQKQTSFNLVMPQDNQDKIQVSISNLKNNGLMKSSILPQSKANGKILISREQSAKKAIRVGHKCVICSKGLSIEDSLQLACSHRCHKDCENVMKWRMRYKCDVCEVKHDFSRCSIALHMKKRRRKY